MAVAELLFNGVSLETQESRQLLHAKSSLQMLGMNREVQVPRKRLKEKPVTDSGVLLSLCLTIFSWKTFPPLAMESPETEVVILMMLCYMELQILCRSIM